MTLIEGHHYDHLVFDVTAFHKKDREFLGKDWEEHRGYVGDPEGLSKHEEEREKRQIHFVTEYWFNISKKFQYRALNKSEGRWLLPATFDLFFTIKP